MTAFDNDRWEAERKARLERVGGGEGLPGNVSVGDWVSWGKKPKRWLVRSIDDEIAVVQKGSHIQRKSISDLRPVHS